jgi:hypothetical protein
MIHARYGRPGPLEIKIASKVVAVFVARVSESSRHAAATPRTNVLCRNQLWSQEDDEQTSVSSHIHLLTSAQTHAQARSNHAEDCW